MLVLDKVQIKFGKKVLFKKDKFSFILGKINVISGRNGSGKTSLLSCLNNQIKAKFKVTLNNVTIKKKELKYISSYSLVFSQILENYIDQYSLIELFDYLDKTYYDFDRDVFIQCCNELELENKIEQPLLTFSSGEIARSLICLTLSKKASIYLLDEPFNNINESLCLKVFKLLNSICLDKYVIISHHIDYFKLPTSNSIDLDNHNNKNVIKEESEEFKFISSRKNILNKNIKKKSLFLNSFSFISIFITTFFGFKVSQVSQHYIEAKTNYSQNINLIRNLDKLSFNDIVRNKIDSYPYLFVDKIYYKDQEFDIETYIFSSDIFNVILDKSSFILSNGFIESFMNNLDSGLGFNYKNPEESFDDIDIFGLDYKDTYNSNESFILVNKEVLFLNNEYYREPGVYLIDQNNSDACDKLNNTIEIIDSNGKTKDIRDLEKESSIVSFSNIDLLNKNVTIRGNTFTPTYHFSDLNTNFENKIYLIVVDDYTSYFDNFKEKVFSKYDQFNSEYFDINLSFNKKGLSFFDNSALYAEYETPYKVKLKQVNEIYSKSLILNISLLASSLFVFLILNIVMVYVSYLINKKNENELILFNNKNYTFDVECLIINTVIFGLILIEFICYSLFNFLSLNYVFALIIVGIYGLFSISIFSYSLIFKKKYVLRKHDYERAK